MKKIVSALFLFIILMNLAFSQTVQAINKILYSSDPNHRELVLKSFELAEASGFLDTAGITHPEIRDRLEAGAYSEDYENIPGFIGEHFPNPWNMGDQFDFNDLYPVTKIPYGSILDNASGWFRGLSHGYDPVQGFVWPGALNTTIGWANDENNSFSWDNAVNLYKSGMKAEAYECLGHLLHLLADLSIPSHVKVVNHGISVISINSGNLIDPDLLVLIVDEYEMALSGGLSIPYIADFIPDLLPEFRNSLNTAEVSNIPQLQKWQDYFTDLALYTYSLPSVNKYYLAPAADGLWGAVMNQDSSIAEPKQYGITPPSKLSGRWAQIAVKSTAGSTGTVIHESDLIILCNDLVPKAAEYGAGLIKYFLNSVIVNVKKGEPELSSFSLSQNYPNPFNPTTNFKFCLPAEALAKAGIGDHGLVSLKVYDILGNEVATIVNKELPAGNYKYQWNAGGLASGVYFYRLQAGMFVDTKKLILLR
ncbi:MAG TPA: T9SS type A sorting domain-containing protein [Ignavibacteriaceae bacterium]|nr:T9SS type A sorting domain-containing protein [Ignavibacteriaceae bacterium]